MDWAALPPELLYIILGKLAEATDHVRFFCTCCSWRSVARSHPMPLSFPWLFLPHKRSTANLKFYSFSENRIYEMAFPEIHGSRQITGSASGFLLVVGEDQSSKDLIINPFTRERAHLPSIHSDATVITWDYSGSVVVACFGYPHGVAVAYCRPSDHCWCPFPTNIIGSTYTIIYKSGSFYLQPNSEQPFFYVLDAETLKLTRSIICPNYNCRHLRFVPTTDDTLLCLRFNIMDDTNSRYCPVLYKLNRQNFSWSKTIDIGDYALFDDDRFVFVFKADRHAELWKTVHFPALSKKYGKSGSYRMNTLDFGNLLSEAMLDANSYSSCPFWILPSFGTM